MSADELYALAVRRKQEEKDLQKAKLKEQVDVLRQKRREVLARHKKELNRIDAQIRKLGGRTGGGARRGRRGTNVTDMVLDILAKGKASTKEIKAALDKQGVAAGNLSQTLAYLKRTGRVTSPSRAVYARAK